MDKNSTFIARTAREKIYEGLKAGRSVIATPKFMKSTTSSGSSNPLITSQPVAIPRVTNIPRWDPTRNYRNLKMSS